MDLTEDQIIGNYGTLCKRGDRKMLLFLNMNGLVLPVDIT